MGITPTLYFDTCIAIYLVEEHPIYCAPLEAALATSSGVVCFSPLVEMESLILPLRNRRDDLLAKFHAFFAVNRRLSMPDEVFFRAAELRARFALKTPDALHLATAQYHRCTELWTNDDRLCTVGGGIVVNILA